MIEEIVKVYAKIDGQSGEQARVRLTRLVKSASSEGRVDERVIAYLRELQSKSTARIHQLPYVLVSPFLLDSFEFLNRSNNLGLLSAPNNR